MSNQRLPFSGPVILEDAFIAALQPSDMHREDFRRLFRYAYNLGQRDALAEQDPYTFDSDYHDADAVAGCAKLFTK